MATHSPSDMIEEAYSVLNRLIVDEEVANKMLAKATFLNNSVLKMKEYQNTIKSMEDAAHSGKTSFKFIASNDLDSLKNDNRRLKVALEDHQFALELVMSKYRQQFCKLLDIRKTNRVKSVHDPCPVALIDTLANRINEMANIMYKTIKLEENARDKGEELKSQLCYENECLRGLVEMAIKSNSVKKANLRLEELNEKF